jgi:hypothetical protein
VELGNRRTSFAGGKRNAEFGLTGLCQPVSGISLSPELWLVFDILANIKPFWRFLIFVMILCVVAGVVSIIAELSLMSGGQSTGIGLLAGFLGLINGPLGIALGAYTLVVLVPVTARDS